MNKLTNMAGSPMGRKTPKAFIGALLAGLLAGVSSMPAVSGVTIDNKPLNVARSVPGNLALVPSVEYPTIHSQANIGAYDTARRYSGYFDPGKCYAYHYSTTETERHFYPVSLAAGFTCAAEKHWSGNYLNWAATQTIDPFRSALTGGYRVRDVANETWLEKARHAPGYALYPNRRLPNSGDNTNLVRNLTASRWNNLSVRIQGLGNRMRFSASGNLDNAPTAYNPDVHALDTGDAGTVYEVSVRVKVCDASVGVEANCKRYSQGWKPEGLIQEYSERIRYSIFGFLNQTGNDRNGGVMRARQKFVGPNTHYPEVGVLANANREWDPTTGVLIDNPDPGDATATGHGVANSGVINYLNKFGQMTNENPKGNDPVSELYYAALRYFRGQGNLASYTNNVTYNRADGFPVITNWDDPIRYSCQVNAALGIGDVYTHQDHDIPTTPADDRAIARTYTQKIFDLEGIEKNSTDVFSGRGNSAYIAGLAYYAHTNDLRLDNEAQSNTKGRQTLSTYWVDVRENQRLEPKTDNQYWLAAKYGGFDVPDAFNPLTTTGLSQAWWHTSGEYLNSGANGGVTTTVTTYPRPDNFYVASEADKMVASLRQAFDSIVSEMQGSGGSFASNTTRLETGAYTYQAKYQSAGWGGQLIASSVNSSTGQLTEQWNAATWLTGSATTNDYTKRKLLYNNGGTLTNFISNWNNYTVLASPSLSKPAGLSSTTDAQLKYLLGDRSGERQFNGTFRNRQGMLGDIINSQPVYVAAPTVSLYKDDASYTTFLQNQASRTPVVYVGANDGMLHAINAGTGADRGKEMFAFMPTAAMAVLTQNDPGSNRFPNWRPEYDHAYSMDGEITVADVKTATGWKTILVASMGRGGKSVFALDVTNPASPSMLWEKSASDISTLGNSLGKPIIAKVADGDWRVFLGNGPNSGSGGSTLIALNVLNGNNAGSISAGTGADNGLGPVNVWDSNGDGNFDTVYAGDMAGDLYKFTIGGAAVKLFAAGTTQPITIAPLVAKNPYNPPDTWVFFGTGRDLSLSDYSDSANANIQGWYGFIDGGALIAESSLEEVTITYEDAIGRVLSENAGLASGKKGWFIDLKLSGGPARGERMVEPNFFQGFTLIGTTRFPVSGDPCAPSGKGYTMAINPFTGGRLGSAFFDNDGDGTVGDTGDQVNGVPYSGVAYESGPNNPIFIGDIMYTSLDDGSSKITRTSSTQGIVRRVSWRELLNGS